LLLDHIEWAFVSGWAYLSPRPVAPLRDAGPLTPERWEDLVRRSPELGARLAVSERVFPDKVWRHDLERWDAVLKPALVVRHRAAQAVDPAAADDDALLSLLDRCRATLRSAIRTHHRFDVTPVLPVGELLVRCKEWLDAPPVAVLGLLRGAGPLSVGASEELWRAAGAIRVDGSGRAALESPAGATDVLTVLRASAAAGPATSRYLDVVSHWSAGSGFDVDEPSMVEMPGLLLESLRVAVAGDGQEQDGDDGSDTARDLRRSVAAAHRAEFDEAVAEARVVHRLRDERALYCDVWANGLMRRAILAAGGRLAERGRLQHPAHLVEATYAEMRSLLSAATGPAAADLAERAEQRRSADPAGVPPVLGRSSRTPVPTAWLPEGAARTEQAFRTYLAAMDGDDEPSVGSTIRGVAASPGVYEGPAVVIRDAAAVGRARHGDVLVTEATSPAFNIVLPLVGALVTDRGGMLSHAAIVAREYGVPAVVGCDDATRRIPDGARVRVDGGTGEVSLVPAPIT
jgi:pyruvate,water dikinase